MAEEATVLKVDHSRRMWLEDEICQACKGLLLGCLNHNGPMYCWDDKKEQEYREWAVGVALMPSIGPDGVLECGFHGEDGENCGIVPEILCPDDQEDQKHLIPNNCPVLEEYKKDFHQNNLLEV